MASPKAIMTLGSFGLVAGDFAMSWHRGTGASEKVGGYIEGMPIYGPYDVRRNANWCQFRYGLYDMRKLKEENTFGWLLTKIMEKHRCDLGFRILPYKFDEAAFEFLESQRIGNIRYIDWAFNHHPCYKPETKFGDTVEVPYNYRRYYGQITID